jgi:hypothetical protein
MLKVGNIQVGVVEPFFQKKNKNQNLARFAEHELWVRYVLFIISFASNLVF